MKKISFIVLLLAVLLPVFPVFSQEKQNKKTQETVTETLVPEMSVTDNKLTLKNAPVGKQLVIYTIIGNKVRQIEIKSPNDEFELKLPRAIYIFKLDGIVKKFVIK